MVVGAHPDDAEYYCGGTICRCIERGDEVFIAVVTNGECGADGMSKEEVSAVRKREAQAAADLVGAKMIWIGLPDARLLYTEEHRMKIIEAIRQTAPDMILTHSPDDYHPDHVNTGRLTVDASLLATLSSIDTPHPAMDKPASVYYMEHCAGIDFSPEYYVDITSVFELKKRMLECHAGQVSWLVDQFGMSLVSDMETIAAFRGIQCGVRYAEGFRQVRAFPRADAQRLLP
jgi:LmbE family N-acetylglucosaminyl deacetylase